MPTMKAKKWFLTIAAVALVAAATSAAFDLYPWPAKKPAKRSTASIGNGIALLILHESDLIFGPAEQN